MVKEKKTVVRLNIESRYGTSSEINKLQALMGWNYREAWATMPLIWQLN